jgi:hypothetical protein
MRMTTMFKQVFEAGEGLAQKALEKGFNALSPEEQGVIRAAIRLGYSGPNLKRLLKFHKTKAPLKNNPLGDLFRGGEFKKLSALLKAHNLQVRYGGFIEASTEAVLLVTDGKREPLKVPFKVSEEDTLAVVELEKFHPFVERLAYILDAGFKLEGKVLTPSVVLERQEEKALRELLGFAPEVVLEPPVRIVEMLYERLKALEKLFLP